MNGVTPSGVPGTGTALQHCTAWLQAAVPGHPLQCDGLQRDDPRVRHRAAVERIHLAGAGGQQHYTDMLTHPSPGRRHLRRVLDVPGDGAALPSALLRPPLPADHARHQQEHCRQVAGREEYVIRIIFARYLFPRIDKKVTGFNRRVENIILHLRSQQFQDEVNDFTEEVVSTFSKVPIPRISFQSVE